MWYIGNTYAIQHHATILYNPMQHICLAPCYAYGALLGHTSAGGAPQDLCVTARIDQDEALDALDTLHIPGIALSHPGFSFHPMFPDPDINPIPPHLNSPLFPHISPGFPSPQPPIPEFSFNPTCPFQPHLYHLSINHICITSIS